jgi:hypothetical protein
MLTGLHFLLSYRCTYECDHCFLYCGPHASGTFTLAQIRQVLDEAEKIGTIEWVYFEGGEPFLYYPLMIEGIRSARQKGFDVGVVSNAYWAETEADAEVWLRPFRGLGVADFSVSDDAFHHGDVEETPAARARAAAENIALPVGAICLEPPDQAEGVMLRGRAAETLREGLPTRPAREFTACNDEELREPERLHLDAFGNVHICQGVLMGNMWKTPLHVLEDTYDPTAHPICGPLLAGGPAKLAADHGMDMSVEYASACHLCYETRKKLRAEYPEHLGPALVYGEA